MSATITFQNVEYKLTDLNEESRGLASALQKVEKQIIEHQKLIAVLKRAKDSYIYDLKKNVLANKAGLNFLD